jgi:hypothetical protein
LYAAYLREHELRKALAEEGLLTVDDGHYTACVTVDKQKRRVLKLRRAAVEQIAGGRLSIAGDRFLESGHSDFASPAQNNG